MRSHLPTSPKAIAVWGYERAIALPHLQKRISPKAIALSLLRYKGFSGARPLDYAIPVYVPLLNKIPSSCLLLTKPGNTTPPPYFQRLNS